MRIYFGKVHIDGLENVPRDKPLILAANHQSAFIEPVLLGGIMPFPVHFITRGDIFVKNWMWFFNAVNMVPIFRFHDGFSAMKKNMDSFQHVYDALNKGARIIIFCEGQMKWEKKLHSLQLGAARMAVGAHDQYRDLDIHVIPIGINYENHLRFRRYVRLSFGTPIRLTDHTEGIDENQRPALVSVTKALAKHLKPEVIHISSEESYDEANAIVTMQSNQASREFFPLVSYNDGTTKPIIAIADKTSKLDKDTDFLESVQQYINKVGNPFKFRDYVLSQPNDFGMLNAILFYVLVLPIGVVGILINALPFLISNTYIKSKIKAPEFIGSLKSNMSSFLYIFYVTIIVIVLMTYCWHLALIGFTVLLVTGIFATLLWDRWPYWRAHAHVKSLPLELKNNLRTEREEILKNI